MYMRYVSKIIMLRLAVILILAILFGYCVYLNSYSKSIETDIIVNTTTPTINLDSPEAGPSAQLNSYSYVQTQEEYAAFLQIQKWRVENSLAPYEYDTNLCYIGEQLYSEDDVRKLKNLDPNTRYVQLYKQIAKIHYVYQKENDFILNPPIEKWQKNTDSKKILTKNYTNACIKYKNNTFLLILSK